MPQHALAGAKNAPLSLDHYLASFPTEGFVVFIVTGKVNHPLTTAGDVLIIDTNGQCSPNDWMLFRSHEHYLLEQHKDLAHLIRRSRLFLAGSVQSSLIQPVGRVVAWMSAALAPDQLSL